MTKEGLRPTIIYPFGYKHETLFYHSRWDILEKSKSLNNIFFFGGLMPSKQLNIFLVSNHSFTKYGIRNFIKTMEKWSLVGESDCQKMALIMREVKTKKAQVLILDLDQSDRHLSNEFIQQLNQNNPSLKIILLIHNQEEIYWLLNSSINGCLLTSEDEKELIRAIKWVMQDKEYYSPQIAIFLAEAYKEKGQNRSDYYDGLTERESEIAFLVCQKKSNREIAHQLTIKVSTVRSHIRNINAKLGINCRTLHLDDL